MTSVDGGIYLCASRMALGEPVKLGDVEDVAAGGAVDRLVQEGLAFARIASGGSRDLVRHSLEATLAASASRPDAVVHSTSTRWDDVAEVVVDVGLATVPTIGVTGNACANFAPALRVARSLLVSEGDVRSVAMTLVDDAGDRPRLMADEIGVLSDGAATCLVMSDRPVSGWAVTGLETATEWRLATDHDADDVADAAATHSMNSQIKRAIQRIEAGASTPMSEYDIVLTNNYTWSLLEAFAQIIGVPVDRIYDDNRGDVSHCFGADPLIDLATIERIDPPSGARAIALVCGPGVWSLISLERL